MGGVRSILHLGSVRSRGEGPARGAQGNGPRPLVEIVPMRRKHLKSVIAIERRIFPTPWTIGLYSGEIAQPETRAYYVACVGDEVAGYAGMMVVVGEGHVTNIGVAPQWQRHGVGRRLLLVLAREARRRAAQHMTLEVRVSNLGAQGLYREFGFAPAGVRPNYYSEVHEDALVMWAHDIDTDAYGARLEEVEARLVELDPPRGPGAVPPWLAK
jgi:ribosomal-protein-alanine N-acetyltransferase